MPTRPVTMPAPPAAPPPSPPPIAVGISLSSTRSTGAFAVPVGGTLMGTVVAVAPTPTPTALSADSAPVPSYRVAESPVLDQDFKPPYPDSARKDGREGQVTLELTLDARGLVVAARVLQGAAPDFDAAALAGVKQLRFRPARVGGLPVSTRIPYVVTFLLD